MLFVSHRNQQRPSCCSSTIPRWDGAAPSTWALVGSGAAKWGFTTAEMGGAILGQQQGKGGPFLLAFLFCTSPNFYFFFAPFVVPILERVCTCWIYLIKHHCKMLQRGALWKLQAFPAAVENEIKCKIWAVLCNGDPDRYRAAHRAAAAGIAGAPRSSSSPAYTFAGTVLRFAPCKNTNLLFF